MTDFSKYKNITVDNDTYAIVTKLQTKLKSDVKLSRSQVIKIRTSLFNWKPFFA